jgi:hypothetical protein
VWKKANQMPPVENHLCDAGDMRMARRAGKAFPGPKKKKPCLRAGLFTNSQKRIN